MHKSRNLQPKGSFFVVLVGFPIAKLLMSIKEWSKKVKLGQFLPFWNTELYQPATPRDNLFRDSTCHNVRLKRRCRLNDSRELTNRRLSHDAAAGSRHSTALPSRRNLNLRLVVKTTTLVRAAGEFSRRFWSLSSSFHK